MLLFVALVVAVAIMAYYKWTFVYWKNRNLVCFEEPTLPFGNAKRILSTNFVFGTFYKDIYNIMKSKGYKHAGAFALFKPIYLVNDPDIIKTILQRRFDHFSDRFFHIDETDEPFEANLAFVGGDRWKYMRTKLSPAFTPGKIKSTLDIVIQYAYQMQRAVESGKSEPIDIKQIALCYFTDIIGACGFGLDCNSFKNPNSEFRKHAKILIDVKSKIKLFKLGLKAILPNLARWLNLKVIDMKSYQFFVDLVKETVKFRKNNNVMREDILQLLLEAEPDLKVEEIDNESTKSAHIIHELTGNALFLLIGGFETSSATLTFCLFELATNPDIQDKLRDEIDRILKKHEEKITYEAITDMKYMSQVVDETLRKYTPLPFLTRRCVKDCAIPDTGMIIEKDIIVIISTLGIHHDPEYYPDPERFDPERFSTESRQKRASFTFLPFGEGPRNCPAYRFGLMQIKVGLIVLLHNYTISLNDGTELPVPLDPGNIVLTPKTPILVDFKNCKEY